LLESWNAGWTWVAPNILLSFSLIRIVRPYVQILAQHHWAAFALLVCALFAVLPIASKIADNGAEGWLWALFGLYQRMYVDGRSATDVSGATPSLAPSAHAMTENVSQMRLLACYLAGTKRILVSKIHFAVFILGVGVLSTGLCLFLRGPSRIQPPEVIAGALRFIGRHTLEIYAIQLAGSELLVKLVPDLAP
jgi:hypothetical protein